MTCRIPQNPASAVMQVYSAIWQSYMAMAMLPWAIWMQASAPDVQRTSDSTHPHSASN